MYYLSGERFGLFAQSLEDLLELSFSCIGHKQIPQVSDQLLAQFAWKFVSNFDHSNAGQRTDFQHPRAVVNEFKKN